MGLKRRNPARTRLLTAPEAPAVMAPPAAEAPAIEPPAAPIAEAAPAARRITNEERHRMIARAAYGHAERANFAGDPVNDWLTAEREIDAQLAS